MKLIFFGDLAAPEETDVKIIEEFLERTELFKDKIVIGNLEGLIVNKEEYDNSLYNDIHITKIFKNTHKTVLSLANNHIKDIPEKFNSTIEILEKNDIGFSGASFGEEQLLNPYEFETEGKKFAVFNHCWNVMSRIMKNKSRKIQVEDEPYDNFIQKIGNYKKENPTTKIIVYFHWNFDFEQLPFPSHRVIARKLIDNGVDFVIGSHSHLVNGGEIYKGKIIIYGLGNFYIPSGKFFNGKLIYPDVSDISLLLDVDLEKHETNLIWIKFYRSNKKIEILKKESFEDGTIIKKYSNYMQMVDKEYKEFFKKNRIKNKLVPIWYDEKNNIKNKIKDILITIRMKIFRMIKKILSKNKGE